MLSAGIAYGGASGGGPASRPAENGRERVSTTRHEMTVGGERIAYRAEAGEITVSPGEEQGKEGRFFFVSYAVENEDRKKRPVTFAFNGGPGAASVWLHLGALGPRKLVTNPDGTPAPPPPAVADNPLTWLAFTDLVFVDPVGTGYSRSLSKDDGAAFWDVRQDVRSVAEFIRLYLTTRKRWLSPKYLAGESYGSTRAAAMANHLETRLGIKLNGMVLVSPALDFATLHGGGGRNLPYALRLPACAAAAAYHGRGAFPADEKLEERLAAVKRYALGDYLGALLKGGARTAEESAALYRKVAELTGLEPAIVRRHRGRIGVATFTRRLLEDKELLVGRMDATVTGVDPRPGAAHPSFDPSLRPLFGPFSAAVNACIRAELAYESEKVYEFLNPETTMKWDWTSGIKNRGMGQGYINAAESLKEAMTANPALRVLMACGMFDLATPCFATAYTVNQVDLHPTIRPHLVIRRYRAGHMIYLHAGAAKKLHADVAAFYAGKSKD